MLTVVVPTYNEGKNVRKLVEQIDDALKNIDYEVMIEEQKPYVARIKDFASLNGYKVLEMTYGNKPNYDDSSQAPVYRLEINVDTKSAVEIGKEIMISIFNCNATTTFDVVP